MTKAFAPLLSKAVEFDKLDYSNLWLSAKYDGIRAIIRDGVVVSRKLLPIPNDHVQNLLGGRPELEGYDGELIVGPPYADDVYAQTYSGVMKKDGTPDVQFFVFDHVGSPNDPYNRRLEKVDPNQRHIKKVCQHRALDESDVLELELFYLSLGYEGVMLRAIEGPNSFYKYGRSTAKSNTLLKLKRMESFEAQIVGFEEEQFNGNEATTDALGRTKRSSHQENKVGKATLGAMVCRYEKNGLEFRCGIFKGFTAADKLAIWLHQGEYIGRWGKFQKLPIGEKDRPRHPRFIGWRDPIDF